MVYEGRESNLRAKLAFNYSILPFSIHEDLYPYDVQELAADRLMKIWSMGLGGSLPSEALSDQTAKRNMRQNALSVLFRHTPSARV